MTQHTTGAYDEELRDLVSRIAEMGGLAEGLVSEAVTGLARIDIARAQNVIFNDHRLDDMQRQVEERAISVIARRQPVARDLREIIAALRVSSDLERVGDLAKNIAKRVIAIDGQFHTKRLAFGVEHISEITLEQLKAVLDAYTSQDLDAAHAVRSRDDEIDAMYTSLFRELLTYMMEDPRNITFCTHLLFCAKNIERIGDHATNIAETIHFMITGEYLQEDRPKQDESSYIPAGYSSE
ncbi:phosphate signaling complex protein PhoU [Amorphus orientalis]|uniref:Phosphate-specific transport system accessory protein PhoU n=1 Tax=Amorphus orientalis TaxID=649198 RepID=A0AAE4ATZ6_9HYPH|nr:phosphate signaling complex protein PhoU [Amorphus orientalis]MDQ0316785.1 phosphate transport system protein [Amorphus orientalis]